MASSSALLSRLSLYVTLSFLVSTSFSRARPNPWLPRPGLTRVLSIALWKKTGIVPSSFQPMSRNWIPGFSQRGEQMALANGYERTWGYIRASRKTSLLRRPLYFCLRVCHRLMCVLYILSCALHVSRGIPASEKNL